MPRAGYRYAVPPACRTSAASRPARSSGLAIRMPRPASGLALEANQDLLRALLEEPARRLLAEALRILEPALAASACHALAVRRRDERAQAKPSSVLPFGIGGERDDAASAQRAAHRSFGAHARG